MFCKLSALLCLVSWALAETHEYHWTLNWTSANPDGVMDRQVLAINGEWPLPVIEITEGDRLLVYLTNGLEDQNTTLHFHGMYQQGSNQMDGPEMVTQCPIVPGETMLYNFTVNEQVGTYWYHAHTHGQTGDGFRGVFIVHDREEYPYEFDVEDTLTVAEWYHDNSQTLMPQFLNRYNPTGAEPIPQNILFNDTRNATWHVEPNTTYLLHIVNVGAFVSQFLWMEDHTFTVVEVDGVYVERNETEVLYITVGQRYTVLLQTKDSTDRNYRFMHRCDDSMLDLLPEDLQLNGTNWIVYNSDAELPSEEYYVDSLDPLDDFYLQPLERMELLPDPDVRVTIDVIMDNLLNGVGYAFFNNISYVAPKVPTLVTALTAGEDAMNAAVYGSNTNTFVLDKDEVVEIVLNSQDPGTHPFHLHGHHFQVINRGPDYPDDQPTPFNETDHDPFPQYPMRRDVVHARPNSHFVLRFQADHPGVWFFHCHLEWHMMQGLALTFIEDPITLQQNETLTENYLQVCNAAGIKTEGNAAANSDDFFDLTGENVQVAPLPEGFTARGIVALVFSCIAGLLGCIAIGYYGMQDIPDVEERVARDLGVDLEEEEEGPSALASRVV